MENLKNIEASNLSFRKKDNFKLPKGAEVIKTTLSIYVEEIENGYIETKEYAVEYMYKDDINHAYYTKKYYSKENMLEDVMDLTENEKNEDLADKF